MRIATDFGWLDARVVPGPPQVAVLWHSMFTDSRSWDRVVDDLREKRTLVLVDGWSFGASADLDHVVDNFNDRCVQGAIAVVSQARAARKRDVTRRSIFSPPGCRRSGREGIGDCASATSRRWT